MKSKLSRVRDMLTDICSGEMGINLCMRNAAKAITILDEIQPEHGWKLVAYLRDVDGTGSLHPCFKGDTGAIPVYSNETMEGK